MLMMRAFGGQDGDYCPVHKLALPAPGAALKYDVALLLANGAPVPALMRFSAPVKKHWLGSFAIVLPPSGLRGFVPVVRDRWERSGGAGVGHTRGGGGVGARDPRAYIYIYICICTYSYTCAHVCHC